VTGATARIALLGEEGTTLQREALTLTAVGFAPEVLQASLVAREPEILTGFDIALVLVDEVPSGLDLISKVRSVHPSLLLLAALASTRGGRSIAVTEAGADGFVTSPLRRTEVRERLEQFLERRADREPPPAEAQLQVPVGYGHLNLLSRSPAMRAVYAHVLQLAPSRTTVLVRGETGTGKELIARALHYSSPRKNGPFIAVHCGAIAETIIESELFGHEKGAFTGAVESTKGKFELAHLGTLYLDEIGEMSHATQVKLLRALEEGEVTRVGGTGPIRVDIRIVAATNADLERLLAAGRLRKDLYYRLKVVVLELPPLRERREDIPLLTEAFLRGACERNHLPLKTILPEAVEMLSAYPWPGNVRELKNVVESACVLTRRKVIRPEELPEYVRRPAQPAKEEPRPTPEETFNLDELERRAIGGALEAAGGNRKRAAGLLGISERTLYRKLKEYDL
jgi:DNA-binding NtrC family response regulator